MGTWRSKSGSLAATSSTLATSAYSDAGSEPVREYDDEGGFYYVNCDRGSGANNLAQFVFPSASFDWF